MRIPHGAVVGLFLVTALAGCFSDDGALEALSSEGDAASRGGPTASDVPGPGSLADPGQDPTDSIKPDGITDSVAVHLGVIRERVTTTLDCRPCPTVTFALDQPLSGDAWLDVRVAWDGTKTPGIALALSDGERTWLGQRGFDAMRIKVPGAMAGDYQVSLAGIGAATLDVFTLSASEPKSDEARLPNIVTLVPKQIGFDRCDEVEQTEQGAQRCLRLGNAIGNVGDGPIEVHLDYPNAALGIAGEAQPVVDGMFSQRIYDWDGGSSDREVGASDFHVAHGHWHYDGFAEFYLYEVDAATGLRSEVAGAGHKSGFCFLDWGEMKEKETTAEAGGRAQQSCTIPGVSGWTMGISAGYFDFYWAGLTDQYVEASGVGDGYFELVSVADEDDWLVETDETDNAASVLLHIQGDEVRVLEERGWYWMPADTRNL